MEINGSSFGSTLKFFLKEGNHKVADIAKQLGVSKSAVYHWIADETFPESDKIDALSSILNVNLALALPEEKKDLRDFLLKKSGVISDSQEEFEQKTVEVNAPPVMAVPFLKFNQLYQFLEQYSTLDFRHDWIYLDADLVKDVTWGTFQNAIVVLMQGELPLSHLVEGDKLLCTSLGLFHWRYITGVYILLFKSLQVQIRRILRDDEEYFYVELQPGIEGKIFKNDVYAIWTVHYAINPRLIR